MSVGLQFLRKQKILFECHHTGGCKPINQIIGLCFAKLSWQQETEHGGLICRVLWERVVYFFPLHTTAIAVGGSGGAGREARGWGRWTDTALLRCALLKTTEHTGTDRSLLHGVLWVRVHKARYRSFKKLCTCTCQGNPVMQHSLHFESP